MSSELHMLSSDVKGGKKNSKNDEINQEIKKNDDFLPENVFETESERGDLDSIEIEQNTLEITEIDNGTSATNPQDMSTTQTESETKPVSKSQLKRQLKHEKWLQIKTQKRKDEKMKRKRRFAEAREKGEQIGPSRKTLKRNSMQNSECKVKVALDCSFDSYMTPKDVVHLVQQIQHGYAVNRRAANPLQFYVCGIDGKTKERLQSIGDYRGWDLFVKEESYVDAFPKESIVYLSSESPNVLHDLDDDHVYVIGGLVDHNHYKGLCHSLAEEKGVSHAQLPIGDHIDMKTRKVLTINHVFEILLKYTESHDWKHALSCVLPLRKGFSVLDRHVEGDERADTEQNDSLDKENVAEQDIITSDTSESLRIDPTDDACGDINDTDDACGDINDDDICESEKIVATPEQEVSVLEKT